MNVRLPTRFSLRTLLIAMGIVSVALAVWARLPDPNNTLPMERLVGKNVLEREKVGKAPRVIVLKVEPAPDFEQGGERVFLALVNPSPYTLHYAGYTMDSWSERPAPGEIMPLFSTQVRTDGVWAPKPNLRCGTGVGDLRVRPGHAGRFDTWRVVTDAPIKIGVSCTWEDETGIRQGDEFWSEAIGVED